MKKKGSVLNRQSVRRHKKRSFLVPFYAVCRAGIRLLKASAFLTIIAAISISFLFLYHYLLTSPYLRLEQVDVEGVDEEIKHELVHMSGLNSDMSLMALNLNELKLKMEEHPWVRSVKLERRYPHTLIVQAEKEIPSAVVVMDKLHYMNRWGEVFKEAGGSEKFDLPVVTGVGGEKKSESERQLSSAANIIKALESAKGLLSLDELSEIHISKGEEMSLYFNHLMTEIKLMHEDLPAKMEELKKVMEHLIGIGRIHQVKSIDLHYRDGVVVAFRQG